MTLLAELVGASARVGATAARKSKVRELALLLGALAPEEIDIGVHYLSGDIPQGKIGIGYSAVRTAACAPAADSATLSLAALDRSLTQLAAIQGAGSAATVPHSVRARHRRVDRGDGPGEPGGQRHREGQRVDHRDRPIDRRRRASDVVLDRGLARFARSL